ncbi:hypothetical protein PR202_gb13810 [Eleusine coracana subsp. coracana]|uniref:Sugar phosphate transporter domain-containing protein n=1 Tax=Eleusine coracana subsp. coracana TaxID=191504 RepID=A0AAV5ETU0_ELECO|nr:hypothetical protein PR202_gb13810 [Eleusine coracana subsp. coracana]
MESRGGAAQLVPAESIRFSLNRAEELILSDAAAALLDLGLVSDESLEAGFSASPPCFCSPPPSVEHRDDEVGHPPSLLSRKTNTRRIGERREEMEDGGKAGGLGTLRAVLAILQWWGFNVTVIIMNKWIFQVKPLIEVELEDRWKRIFPMSFVFCINIVLGNVSLRYIPVSFMQTIKSFTPATTVILQWLVWSKQFEWRIWASLVPIVGGILLTSITELSFNVFGFCAAMVGCLATSTKTILAESLLHGYKFDSINTVYYMAPFATMILALPAMLLEGGGVINWFYTHDSIMSALIIILGSGVLAFCLNFSIFYVIHSTTAVTFNVAGNLKVAVAVLVSWLIFRNPISAMNAIGCGITLVGCTFYGYVRHLISQRQAVTSGTVRVSSPGTQMEMLPLVDDKQEKV